MFHFIYKLKKEFCELGIEIYQQDRLAVIFPLSFQILVSNVGTMSPPENSDLNYMGLERGVTRTQRLSCVWEHICCNRATLHEETLCKYIL